MGKFFIELTEALIEGGLREAPNKNITHIEVTKKIGLRDHTSSQNDHRYPYPLT